MPTKRTWITAVSALIAANILFVCVAQAAPGEFTNSNQALDAVPLTPNCSTPTNCFDFSVEAALGDLDGDGDLDAVVSNASYQYGPTGSWFNDGSGVFTSGQVFGPEGMDVEIGDLDNDGDNDVFFVVNGSAGEVWLNNGSGVLSKTGQVLTTICSGGCEVELADLDGDGDRDAFMAGIAGSQVFLNDGDGFFVFAGQNLIGGAYLSLADMDGDGDLDAYVSGLQNTLLINDGSGGFNTSGQVDLGGSGVVDLGDVDGDGDNDVFIGGGGGSTSKVWLNDGNGILTDTLQNIFTCCGSEVTLEDLDGDGDLDAFLLGGSSSSYLLINNGAGVFTISQTLPTGGIGMGLGDVNGDGSYDAFIARGRIANEVWLNEPNSDTDGDGLQDDDDNCPAIFNSDQADFNSNGIGDVCEDTDTDAVLDSDDNCPAVFNSDQADFNSNGIGDVCEDTDSDAVLDIDDNCPAVANADQVDADSDQLGDICDDDDDNDGVLDNQPDSCPATRSGDIIDSSGCSIAQLCPADDNWKNHGKYVSCVTHIAKDFQKAGLITPRERSEIVSTAAQSDVGKQ